MNDIRWEYIDSPKEKGEYLCVLTDARENYTDTWFESVEYSPTALKAFGKGWALSNFDEVLCWADIGTPEEVLAARPNRDISHWGKCE